MQWLMRGSGRQEGQVPAHEAQQTSSVSGDTFHWEAGLLTTRPHTVPFLPQVSRDGWRVVRCGPEMVLGVGRLRPWLGDLGRRAV